MWMNVRLSSLRRIFLLFIVLLLLSLACRSSQPKDQAVDVPSTAPPQVETGTQPSPTSAPQTEPESEPTSPPEPEATSQPLHRAITSNDFIPEQTNYIDTLVVVVNFSDRHDRPFDFSPYWERVFGTDDPIRQLNAYYDENFYGQLQMRPVEVGPNGYVEVELEGAPQDYSFGWLIGLEDENIDQVDPDAVQHLLLEIMYQVVLTHPEINYQDVFMFLVLNATGAEYGRGAAGALPTGGFEPIYDMFIGDLLPGDEERFSDPHNFRIVEDKVVGVIHHSDYTFEQYFNDRGDQAQFDQFVLGIAIFGRDAPLSCASHDILHGLRRKSAYADPPEGRQRAINCLYNLPLQSWWLVGRDGHGSFDRSVNASPYIGWWDPMGDHLHPTMPREFFDSHPHGMSAFTKLRMGLIPERCQGVITEDDLTVRLAPLSNPRLPDPGAEAEWIAIKVPMMPDNPEAAHIYLLLEYRRLVEGGEHPDNFTIDPEYVFGDIQLDPGYNAADPAASRFVNPPTTFVSKEGVLVYLVNEKMPELPVVEYDPAEWYKFVVVLLNPAGNEQRDDLTQAPLAAGENIVVDFQNLYAHGGVPVTITVTVTELTPQYAQVHIVRQDQR
jgi:hypothetical protein